ncbi:HEPN domain-containing protein [Aquisphaera insulae]|uniref:HEPN domain-containing protein n=1 Tax=Aquisphaera insulae TaxID=2712864 RepID=UPI0013EC1CBE
MANPRSKEARKFYRCAGQRFVEAEVLQKADHPTGAVYLAGYSIECALKSLILAVVAPTDTQEVLHSFRGARAHDYNWLRQTYRLRGGASLPTTVIQDFTLVDTWSTDLRYEPATLHEHEAKAFLDAAGRLIQWAKGRL